MGSIWEGERVRLRGIEPGDWEAVMRFDQWSDDVRSGGLLFQPRSAEGYRQWAAERAARAPQVGADEFELAIESLAEECLVGGIGTHQCDRVAGTFGYGLGIGRPHQRRGYASEAIVLLLRYMFGERRYQKCNVGVYAYNTASLELHAKLGFVVEGRRRRAAFMGGRHHDEVLLGLTVEEFTAAHPLPDVGAAGD
jgi:RimJ/RimL family protein N-acetyltransferase